MRKIVDELYHYRGTWNLDPQGVVWVRIFREDGAIPVVVLSELPANVSTSVTNMAEFLVPEILRRYLPERFEEEVPAIIIEHYVEERTPRGRLGRKATWDRLLFESWTPRVTQLSGTRRLTIGEPDWVHLPEDEVIALIGAVDVAAKPPKMEGQYSSVDPVPRG
jgi:hypothetical protein